MFNPSADKAYEHKIRIAVGEPWDFKSPDGGNIIIAGLILRISAESPQKEVWILKTRYENDVDGFKFRNLVLRSRHFEQTLDRILVGENIPVTVGGIQGELDLAHIGGLIDSAKFVIIGSASLA